MDHSTARTIFKKKYLLNYICYETDNGDKDGSTSLFSVINDPMILQERGKLAVQKPTDGMKVCNTLTE